MEIIIGRAIMGSISNPKEKINVDGERVNCVNRKIITYIVERIGKRCSEIKLLP